MARWTARIRFLRHIGITNGDKMDGFLLSSSIQDSQMSERCKAKTDASSQSPSHLASPASQLTVYLFGTGNRTCRGLRRSGVRCHQLVAVFGGTRHGQTGPRPPLRHRLPSKARLADVLSEQHITCVRTLISTVVDGGYTNNGGVFVFSSDLRHPPSGQDRFTSGSPRLR